MAWIATTNAQTTYNYNVQGWTPYGSLTLQNLTINDAGALNINGSLNMTGNAKTRGNLEFRWKNDSDGTGTYSNAIKTNRDWLEIDSTTSIKKDTTIEGEATVKNKLKVQSTSNSEIRVDKICDQNGSISSCKTVSTLWQGWGGGDYWKLNGSILQTSGWNYGIGLYNWSDTGLITLDNNWLNINWWHDTDIKIAYGSSDRYIKIDDDEVEIKWWVWWNTIKISSSSTTLNWTTKINKNIWETALEVTGNVKLHRNNSWDRYISYDRWGGFQVHDFMTVTWWLVVAESNLVLQSGANLVAHDNATIDGNATINGKLSVKINDINTFWVSVNNATNMREVVASGQSISLRGPTEVKNLLSIKTEVSAFQNTNYSQNQNSKILSQIKLVPAWTGIIKDNYGQERDNISNIGGLWYNLADYAPCDSSREWTIMYYRRDDGDSSRSNRQLYWKFIWCACYYDLSDAVFTCKRRIIASSDPTDNANNIESAR